MESKQIAVVTGSNGFIGSHLVDLLIKEGFLVRCIVRESSSLRWLDGKDIEIIKTKTKNKIRAELLLRMSKGYENINLDLVEVLIDKNLKDLNII